MNFKPSEPTTGAEDSNQLSNDMRDNPVYETDRTNLAQALESGLPLATDRVPYDTSGFDGLVWVIRRTYSFFVTQSNMLFAPEIREQDSASPILAYTWRTQQKEHISNDEMEAEAAAKSAAIHALIAQGHVEKQDLSFLALARCPDLNEALWSRGEFSLFQTAVQETVNGSYRHLPLSNQESAERNLVKFDRNTQPDTSLQQLIDRSLGRFPREEDPRLKEIRMVCSGPAFVRILYTGNPEHPLCFEDLWTMQLPIHPTGADGMAVWQPVATKHARYCLIAIVRLRRNPHEPDQVIMYRRRGSVIELGNASVVAGGCWDVADPLDQGQYMLLYAWSPEREPLISRGQLRQDLPWLGDAQEALNEILRRRKELRESDAAVQGREGSPTGSSTLPQGRRRSRSPRTGVGARSSIKSQAEAFASYMASQKRRDRE